MAKRTRTHLPLRQKYLLAHWLNAECPTIETRNLGVEEAAKKASKDLKFQVKATHMRSAMQMLGIDKWPTSPRRRSKKELLEEIERLKAELARIKTGRAAASDPASNGHRSAEEKVLAFLKEKEQPMATAAIAQELGIAYSTVAAALARANSRKTVSRDHAPYGQGYVWSV